MHLTHADVRHIINLVGSETQVATATRATGATVPSHWFSDKHDVPDPTKDQVEQLRVIEESMTLVSRLTNARKAKTWFISPDIVYLGGATPRDAIALGMYDQVMQSARASRRLLA